MNGNVSCSESVMGALYVLLRFLLVTHIYLSVTLTTWVDTSKSSEPAKVATFVFLDFVLKWVQLSFAGWPLY